MRLWMWVPTSQVLGHGARLGCCCCGVFGDHVGGALSAAHGATLQQPQPVRVSPQAASGAAVASPTGETYSQVFVVRDQRPTVQTLPSSR